MEDAGTRSVRRCQNSHCGNFLRGTTDWDTLGACMEDESRSQALWVLPAKVRGAAGRFLSGFGGCLGLDAVCLGGPGTTEYRDIDQGLFRRLYRVTEGAETGAKPFNQPRPGQFGESWLSLSLGKAFTREAVFISVQPVWVAVRSASGNETGLRFSVGAEIPTIAVRPVWIVWVTPTGWCRG